VYLTRCESIQRCLRELGDRRWEPRQVDDVNGDHAAAKESVITVALAPTSATESRSALPMHADFPDHGVMGVVPIVLCVGQATIDHVFGLDSPIEIGHKHCARRHDTVGGGVAANAAVAVSRLGGRAVLISCVGDDADGEAVIADLRSDGIDVTGVRRIAGRSTPFSAVLVDPSGGRTIVNHTPDDLLTGTPPLLSRFDAVLVDGRWPEASVLALRAARERGLPGVVDADRAVTDHRLLDLASHVVFGEDALASMTGVVDPADGLRAVADRTRAMLAVTAGADGVVWLDEGVARTMPAFAVTAVDTTGAGDAFHGAFTLALAEGADDEAALRFAAATAAVKCTRPGARRGLPPRADVDALLDRTCRTG
jgi:sulfofructose kinase